MSKKMLNAQEAADRLGMSSQTVNAHCWKGKLPGVNLGEGEKYAKWYISEEKVDRLVRKQGPRKSRGRAPMGKPGETGGQLVMFSEERIVHEQQKTNQLLGELVGLLKAKEAAA